MRYIVADDSKLARLSAIKSIKENVGNDVDIAEATNGQEALELASQADECIVILDLTMPIMNGYEALEKILKANDKAKIVVVSADIQQKAQERVISLGAKLHVQKPINPQKMKEILTII